VFFCVPLSQALPAALPDPAAAATQAHSLRRQIGHTSVSRSGGMSIPRIGFGSGNSVWDLILDLISYAGLALLGAVLLIRGVRYIRDN
jgi:hypothetical protein